jgi:hypothetical protein
MAPLAPLRQQNGPYIPLPQTSHHRTPKIPKKNAGCRGWEEERWGKILNEANEGCEKRERGKDGKEEGKEGNNEKKK